MQKYGGGSGGATGGTDIRSNLIIRHVQGERSTMSVLDYSRFFWPIAMAVVFLWMFNKRIKAKAEFCIFATLILFGISRLVSTDILPFVVGSLDLPLKNLMRNILRFHYFGQIAAAIIGWFVVLWLSKRFLDDTHQWKRKTKSWEQVLAADNNAENETR
jgi:hypothetical protein